jgi:hypothetical protein
MSTVKNRSLPGRVRSCSVNCSGSIVLGTFDDPGSDVRDQRWIERRTAQRHAAAGDAGGAFDLVDQITRIRIAGGDGGAAAFNDN